MSATCGSGWRSSTAWRSSTPSATAPSPTSRRCPRASSRPRSCPTGSRRSSRSARCATPRATCPPRLRRSTPVELAPRRWRGNPSDQDGSTGGSSLAGSARYFDQGGRTRREGWERGLRLARKQARLQPTRHGWRLSAVSRAQPGRLPIPRATSSAALRLDRASLAVQSGRSPRPSAVPANPGEIAATLAFVSNELERQGDLPAALANRRAHLAIYERLVARQPGDPIRRQDLATARGFVATLLGSLGRRNEARGLYRQGLAELSGLSQQDPENAILGRWLAALDSGSACAPGGGRTSRGGSSRSAGHGGSWSRWWPKTRGTPTGASSRDLPRPRGFRSRGAGPGQGADRGARRPRHSRAAPVAAGRADPRPDRRG